MFNLIIVDDNKYERNGIRDTTDWNSLGIEVVGVFANGQEALSQMEALHPDIVITDIDMPVMNGITLSEQINSWYPQTKIIFISCHSDFEFAKYAIENGVYGYVLKPIVSDELTSALRKLVNNISQEREQHSEKEKMLQQVEAMLPLVRERFFGELLSGNFESREDIEQRMAFLKLPGLEGAQLNVISIYLPSDSDRGGYSSAADEYYISYLVKSIVESAGDGQIRMYGVQMGERHYAVILIDHRPIVESAINMAVDIHMEIGRRLELSTTIGIGNGSQMWLDLPLLYEQSCKAVNTRFYNGSNPIILYKEIEDKFDGIFTEMPNFESVYQDIKSLILYGETQDMQIFMLKYLEPQGGRPDPQEVKGLAYMMFNMTNIILMETELSIREQIGDELAVWKKLSRFETIAEVEQLIRSIVLMAKEKLSEKNAPGKNGVLVETIKNLVSERYNEQLTIEDISKIVYLSSRHANGVFKRETGQTIFDYITEYRMEIAKKLLLETDSKVSVVAELVGYSNTSYFCLAFKKNVGVTPAEFKHRRSVG